ncbi:MAG TPA: beta-ketoacyl synthase N-terminal-like domain-containing protein [Thermoanaerobaculia bacterium]|nr:beta-ketoacyl synthase N-terminal-like domain-containing protein [Thermoanaerobaculia bacterium]
MRPLAVTGVGIVSPLGSEPCAVLAALDQGQKGLVAVRDAPLAGSGWAGRVVDFDPGPVIPPMRARRLDRASQFAVVAAHRALSAAGLLGEERLRRGLGVVMGTSSAGSGPLTVFLEALYRQSPEAAPPFEFPNTVANAPASHVSIELKLEGPNTTLAHSEAVTGMALVLGRQMIEDGRVTAALVGAVDEWNPYYQLGYEQIGALRGQVEGGGGSLLSEGATELVIEPADAAEARGARVLARILGVGVASAAGEPYRWLPDAGALAQAIRGALAEAGMPAEAVGSVFLAANGVEAMERAEAEALAAVFGAGPLAATGIKGAVGERSTSGALGVAVAALCRARHRLPPYAGGSLASWPAPVRLLAAPGELPPGATLVLLYGFGGNYAAVILS